MAQITRIELRVVTVDRPSAGTDGAVYLGICGREFGIDSALDDFERGSDRTFVLGEASPDENTTAVRLNNDPRLDYPIDSDNLTLFPAYLRFEPESRTDHWEVEFINVRVLSGTTLVGEYQALEGRSTLVLGPKIGKTCYLFRVDAPAPLAERSGSRLDPDS